MATPAISFRLPSRVADYLNKESEGTGKTRIQILVEALDFYRNQNDEQAKKEQETKEKIEAIEQIIRSMHGRYQAQIIDLNERLSKLEKENPSA